MTPKEKAIELVDIYKDITTTWSFNDTITTSVINYDLAKQCALIAVDEIINNVELYSTYWEEVKQEIQKL